VACYPSHFALVQVVINLTFSERADTLPFVLKHGLNAGQYREQDVSCTGVIKQYAACCNHSLRPVLVADWMLFACILLRTWQMLLKSVD